MIMGGAMQDQTHTQTSELLCEICHECGENKYFELEAFGGKRVTPRLCKCERDARKKSEKEDENKQRQYRLDRLRDYSMMDSHFEQCRFENFKIDKYNQGLHKMALGYCEKWQDMKRDNVGFLLYGPPGTGKTYLSFCIANALLDELVPVIAISSIGVLNRIKQTYNSYGKEAEADIINALKSASLLVLDDIGAENDTPWVREKLYEIIDSRYRDGKPMICTTNLTRKQLKDKLTGADGVTRTYDRLVEMCPPIEVTGPSRRINAASKKMGIIKGLIEG